MTAKPINVRAVSNLHAAPGGTFIIIIILRKRGSLDEVLT